MEFNTTRAKHQSMRRKRKYVFSIFFFKRVSVMRYAHWIDKTYFLLRLSERYSSIKRVFYEFALILFLNILFLGIFFRSYHQHHYEQFGNLEGVVKIEGKQYSLQCSGVRDHTVAAKRDWNEFHNYVFHFIRLSNGNSISVGVICVPVMFRRYIFKCTVPLIF